MFRKSILSSEILRKKSSLQNLNWEIMLRQKSARLDNEDSRADCLPHLNQTVWKGSSDDDYDVEHVGHPRKLKEDQLETRHGNTKDTNGTAKKGGSRGANAASTGGESKRRNRRT